MSQASVACKESTSNWVKASNEAEVRQVFTSSKVLWAPGVHLKFDPWVCIRNSGAAVHEKPGIKRARSNSWAGPKKLLIWMREDGGEIPLRLLSRSGVSPWLETVCPRYFTEFFCKVAFCWFELDARRVKSPAGTDCISL